MATMTPDLDEMNARVQGWLGWWAPRQRCGPSWNVGCQHKERIW